MILYTTEARRTKPGVFLVDCTRGFFAAINDDMQALYRGDLTFTEVERRYFAELDARYYNDPAYVEQLRQLREVWLTDQEQGRQTPRHMAAAWLVSRFLIPYQGEI